MIVNSININSKDNKAPKCFTIGNFDGVHKGHQKVINKLITDSKKNNNLSTVLSFVPHPKIFFNKTDKQFNIITNDDKEQILKSFGVDIFYKLEFNNEVASLKPEEFLKNFLIDQLNMDSLIVGENFRFGKNRIGDVSLLEKLSSQHVFRLHVIDTKVSDDFNEIFSSSKIREHILHGRLDVVSDILGRPWSMKGKVQEGDKRARKMKFPTANIFPPETIHPKKGVYVVKISIDGQKYSGIANFGKRPTFDGDKLLLEVNIFDFNEDIYRKELTVEFLTFIRGEIKFVSFENLKKQVQKDIQTAKLYFSNYK